MDALRPKIGVNIFVIKDNELLLGLRKNTSGDGDWGLPGGHLEFGEHLSHGAARELEEETGLKANTVTFLNIVNDPREDCHYIHFSFITQDFDGEPSLIEPHRCYEWRWFNLNSLPRNLFIGHKKNINAFVDKVIFVD